jgi:Ras-related protein Rab-8A
VVSTQQGEALAEEFGIAFFETSAKTNVNINEAFNAISTDIVGRLKNDPDLFSSGESKKKAGNGTTGRSAGQSAARLGQPAAEKKGCC